MIKKMLILKYLRSPENDSTKISLEYSKPVFENSEFHCHLAAFKDKYCASKYYILLQNKNDLVLKYIYHWRGEFVCSTILRQSLDAGESKLRCTNKVFGINVFGNNIFATNSRSLHSDKKNLMFGFTSKHWKQFYVGVQTGKDKDVPYKMDTFDLSSSRGRNYILSEIIGQDAWKDYLIVGYRNYIAIYKCTLASQTRSFSISKVGEIYEKNIHHFKVIDGIVYYIKHIMVRKPTCDLILIAYDLENKKERRKKIGSIKMHGGVEHRGFKHCYRIIEKIRGVMIIRTPDNFIIKVPS